MTNNNDDFEQLWNVYSQPTINESTEETDEDEETVEEGIWDRAKARVAGVKGAAGASATHLKKAFGGGQGERAQDVRGQYDKNKSYNIMNSHAVNIDKQLSSLVTDATKLGIMDADQAEQFAKDISSKVHGILKQRAGNKSFDTKGQKNF